MAQSQLPQPINLSDSGPPPNANFYPTGKRQSLQGEGSPLDNAVLGNIGDDYTDTTNGDEWKKLSDPGGPTGWVKETPADIDIADSSESGLVKTATDEVDPVVHTVAGFETAGLSILDGKVRQEDGLLLPDVGTVTAFGDSITANATGYVPELADLLGVSITNRGVASSQIADAGQIDRIFATNVLANNLSVALLGYNDMRFYGTSANGRHMFRNTLMAASVWLTIPEANKIRGQDLTKVTYAGTWTNQPAPIYAGTLGRYSDNNGSTATIANVVGTSIYVCMLGSSGAGNGTVSVAIDGVVMANSVPLYGIFTTTGNSRTWAPVLLRFEHLSDGPHTVVITANSLGSDVHFMFIASNAVAAGPSFFVGDTLRMPAGGYAVGTPYNAGSPEAGAAYNEDIQNVTNALADDGLPVAHIRVSDSFDPSIHTGVDLVHPNTAGDVNIAGTFYRGINLLTTRKAIEPQRDREYGVFGKNPARTGYLRLPNLGPITWRNVANTADAGRIFGSDASSAAFIAYIQSVRTLALNEFVDVQFISGDGAAAATNSIGRIRGTVTQVSPLQSKLELSVNTGDNQGAALTLHSTLVVQPSRLNIGASTDPGITNGAVAGFFGMGIVPPSIRCHVKETTADTVAAVFQFTSANAASDTESTFSTIRLQNDSTSGNVGAGVDINIGGQNIGGMRWKRTGSSSNTGTFDWLQYTGTLQVVWQSDATGRMGMPQGAVVGAAGGPTITSGTGVPGTTEPNGSIFQRTDGTGPNLYVRENGAWVAK